LLIHERVDVAGAQAAYMIAAAAGAKDHSLTDYLPHWGGAPAATGQTPDSMIELLKTLGKD
jgi:hypothetical protein